MRSEANRVADIAAAAQAITDRLGRHTPASFAASTDSVKATFYDLTIIGEAIRDLVAKRDPSGAKIGEDAAIVTANPDIPWVDWVRLRDIVTHQYYRLAPEIVWRDYEAGEIGRLLECCRVWLAAMAPAGLGL